VTVYLRNCRCSGLAFLLAKGDRAPPLAPLTPLPPIKGLYIGDRDHHWVRRRWVGDDIGFGLDIAVQVSCKRGAVLLCLPPVMHLWTA
jgi:hypothetical protein